MKPKIYLLPFITCLLLSSGLFFKMMHWPSAYVQIGVAFLLLNLGVLPAYFLGRFREKNY